MGFIGRHHTEESKEKMRQSLMGHTFSEETKAKIGRANAGKRRSEAAKAQMRLANLGNLNPMFGRHHTLSTKLLISQATRKLKLTREVLDALYSSGLSTSAIALQYNVDPESVRWWMKKYGIERREPSKANVGKKFSIEHRTRISLTRIRRGLSKGDNNPMAKEANVARYFAKPEKAVWDMLDKYCPGAFRYNGDFSQKVMLNGLIPDFVNVNGRKVVIEVFGDYFHNPKYFKLKRNRTEVGRIEAFAEVGWDCVVIWESELKEPEKVLEKIARMEV